MGFNQKPLDIGSFHIKAMAMSFRDFDHENDKYNILKKSFRNCDDVEEIIATVATVFLDEPEYRNRSIFLKKFLVFTKKLVELECFAQQFDVECDFYRDSNKNKFIVVENEVIQLELIHSGPLAKVKKIVLRFLHFPNEIFLNFLKKKGMLVFFFRVVTLFKEICKLVSFRSNKFERFNLSRKFRLVLFKFFYFLGLKHVAFKLRYRVLGLEEFLELRVCCDSLIDRVVRYKQLAVVTNKFSNKTVHGIIDFFKNRELEEFRKNKIYDPVNVHNNMATPWLDLDFWNDGNTHFFGNLYFGFRKGVKSYECSCKDGPDERFLSMDYLQCRPEMQFEEVQTLLCETEITLMGRVLTGGRHRVFAMIGRLIRGQRYIPFRVDMCK